MRGEFNEVHKNFHVRGELNVIHFSEALPSLVLVNGTKLILEVCAHVHTNILERTSAFLIVLFYFSYRYISNRSYFSR